MKCSIHEDGVRCDEPSFHYILVELREPNVYPEEPAIVGRSIQVCERHYNAIYFPGGKPLGITVGFYTP